MVEEDDREVSHMPDEKQCRPKARERGRKTWKLGLILWKMWV